MRKKRIQKFEDVSFTILDDKLYKHEHCATLENTTPKKESCISKISKRLSKMLK